MAGGSEISLSQSQDDGISRFQGIGHLLFHKGKFRCRQAQFFRAFADQGPGGTVARLIIAGPLGEFGDLFGIHIGIPGQVVAHHGKAGGTAAGNGDAGTAIVFIAPHGIPLEKQWQGFSFIGGQIHFCVFPEGIIQDKFPGLRVVFIQSDDVPGIFADGDLLAFGPGFDFLGLLASLLPGEGNVPVQVIHRLCPQQSNYQQHRQSQQKNQRFLGGHGSYPPLREGIIAQLFQ